MLLAVKDRKVIKLAVTTDAKSIVEEIARRYDIKEYAVAGRIFDWFAKQDDIYQRSVLGFLEGLEVDAAEAYMKRKAREAKERARGITPATSPPLPPAPADASEPATAPDETIVHRTGTGETTKALSRTPPQPQTGQGKQAKPGRKPHGSTV